MTFLLGGVRDAGVLRKGYQCEILTGEATKHSQPVCNSIQEAPREWYSRESGAALPSRYTRWQKPSAYLHLPLQIFSFEITSWKFAPAAKA